MVKMEVLKMRALFLNPNGPPTIIIPSSICSATIILLQKSMYQKIVKTIAAFSFHCVNYMFTLERYIQ